MTYESGFNGVNASCLEPAVDGRGDLIVGIDDVSDSYTMLATSGAQLGPILSGHTPAFSEQADGFVELGYMSGGFGGVWGLSSQDAVESHTSIAPYGGFNAQWADDPLGGTVVALQPQTGSADSGLWSIDPSGAVRWLTPVTYAGSLATVGVDRTGNILVLTRSATGGPMRGRWFTHDGAPGASFDIDLGADVLRGDDGRYRDITLTPRLGSGFFVEVVVYGPHSETWVATLPADATRSEPAPPWLVARPNTRLHPIHGGTGYALFPIEAHLSRCTQSVSIVDSTGTACGEVSLDLEAGACTTDALHVGYDGTVVQQLPQDMEHCLNASHCACTWRWWPALLK